MKGSLSINVSKQALVVLRFGNLQNHEFVTAEAELARTLGYSSENICVVRVQGIGVLSMLRDLVTGERVGHIIVSDLDPLTRHIEELLDHVDKVLFIKTSVLDRLYNSAKTYGVSEVVMRLFLEKNGGNINERITEVRDTRS